MTPTPLLDRIEKKYRTRDSLICRDCGHHLHRPNPGTCQWYDCGCAAVAKVIQLRPVWIERMQSNGLPPKDYTEGPGAA